jgi:sporulation protein YlmC with PRC-barrel domain
VIISSAGFPGPEMKPGEIRFEELLGRTVRNSYGRAIGRIEEARVEPDGEDYVVTHFLLGPLKRWHRLLAFFSELPTLRALGIGHERNLRPLPWHWFDLSDPDRPVLGKTGRRGKTGRSGREEE